MTPPSNIGRNRARSPNLSGNYAGPSKKKMRREGSPHSILPHRLPDKDTSRLHSSGNASRGPVPLPLPSSYSRTHEADYSMIHSGNRSTYFDKKPLDGGFSGVGIHKPIMDPGYLHDPKPSRGYPNNAYPSASGRDKPYGLTLDERFRAVSGSGQGENRIHYTREDLENITIDIKRSSRDFSPTVRRIMNPSEVKLVRRPTEGHRPIFDREEIKQSPRDLREDAAYDQKSYNATPHGGDGSYRLNYKETANYEMSHKPDAHRAPPPVSSGAYTLNDKWQNLDGPRNRISSYDRDERSHGISHNPGAYMKSTSQYQSGRSHDRDFRSAMGYRQRADYHSETKKPLPNAASDARRKDGPFHDDRQRRMKERDQPVGDRGIRHGSIKTYGETGDHIRAPAEKLPDFSQRPDRYKFQAWMDKSDMTPKSSVYFERNNDHEHTSDYYSRNSRGFRGRSFHGSSTFNENTSHGSGYRGRGSPKGRNFLGRKRSSLYKMD